MNPLKWITKMVTTKKKTASKPVLTQEITEATSLMSSVTKKIPDPYGLDEELSNGFYCSCWTKCREEIVFYLFDGANAKPGFYFAFRPERVEKLAKYRLEKKVKNPKSKVVLDNFLEVKPGAEEMAQNITKFIRLAEEKVGMALIERHSVVHPTDKKTIIYIDLSPFWRKTRLNASLFTIFLRAGLYYVDGSSFESTLYMNKYARETMFAIIRFFDGYTECESKQDYGWWQSFSDCNSKQIINLLKTS